MCFMNCAAPSLRNSYATRSCSASGLRAPAANSGARFREFTENHVLVGQIATALLLTEEDKEKALILPSTLDRIAADLDKNQRSKDWLGDARRRADQIRIRGLSRTTEDDGTELVSATGSILTPRQKEILELGLEPKLFLRRTGPDTWAVQLELPDLTSLIQRFPGVRGSSCRPEMHYRGNERNATSARRSSLRTASRGAYSVAIFRGTTYQL